MSERIWAIFWAVVILGFLGSISFWVHEYQHSEHLENVQIQVLVEQGKSPIEARCAIKGNESSEKQALICLAAILRGNR